MDKIIIAAIADNGCIGIDGKLPWHFPADMKYFKEQTVEHAVVMGRKTFASFRSTLGNGLTRRSNIVLSRSIGLSWPGKRAPIYVKDLDEAFDEAENRGHTKCFVIGGAEIYKLALPRVDTLKITRVKGDYDGDTFFPEWPLGPEWDLSPIYRSSAELTFDTYNRAKKSEES